ncbi:unnamed protein product [Euphydryas editha]|nr:unnamed protein product [Euphydryas editha]
MCSSGTARQSDLEPNVRIAFRERGVNWAYFRSTLCARMGIGSSGAEWWTPELDQLRREVNRARRSWQNSRRYNPKGDDALRVALQEARHKYKLAMKETEIKHFKKVAETETLGDLRTAPRLAGYVPPGMYFTEGNSSRNMPMTLKPLCTISCTPYAPTTRVAAAFPPTGGNSAVPDRATVELIIRNLPNTSPGLDGITCRMPGWLPPA